MKKYCWKCMYKDVVDFIRSYEIFHVYSNIWHWDGLHPTYLLVLHYKQIVDLVAMPIELKQMKYLVLTY